MLIVKKSISEMALFMKDILPAEIPETYRLKSMFKDVADEKSTEKAYLRIGIFFIHSAII